MTEQVLVIGAGPAGIVQAYFLKNAGIPYRVIDQSDVIASTWANLYPSLRLNTTRYFSHMPGKPFPWHYGVFPTAKQYHRYLVDFVREHQLNIELGVQVDRLTPAGDGYRVETNRGVSHHPNVVLATGRFSNPYTPRISALDGYTGQMIHAHDYGSPEPFNGQQVMVVGNGPSGMDISIEIGQQNAPLYPALLSMRTGITLRRRYPLGVSKHGWMILARHLPPSIAVRLLDYVENMGYRPAVLRSIKTPPIGQNSSGASTRGPELIHAVRAGQVICVGAPKDADGKRVLIEDLEGQARWVDVDAIILATGYRPALNFLDGITYEADDQGWPLRDNSQPYTYTKTYTYDVGPETDARLALMQREIRGYHGLFVQGLFYKGKGTMYNINIEAEIIAEQIRQRQAKQEPFVSCQNASLGL